MDFSLQCSKCSNTASKLPFLRVFDRQQITAHYVSQKSCERGQCLQMPDMQAWRKAVAVASIQQK